MKKAYCLLATLASLTAPSTMLTAMAGNTQGAAIVTELQEQNTITGVITDTQGEPITGATVAVVEKPWVPCPILTGDLPSMCAQALS